MKDIKLIAMDMDGTLLNKEQVISPGNLAALHEAAAKGIALAICSGRAGGDASIFAKQACLMDCYILALNGAYCLESPHGQVFATHTIPDAALSACIRVLDAYDVTYGCFQENHIILMESRNVRERRYWSTHREGEGAPTFSQGMEALSRAREAGINKIVYSEPESMQRLKDIRKQLVEVDGIEVTSSWSDNLEIMPAGINKGTAVRELAGKLGITAGEVMAIGDQDNDLSMISYAGYGIAMGNALDTVKQAAYAVTTTNAEDGVAEAIWKYAL